MNHTFSVCRPTAKLSAFAAGLVLSGATLSACGDSDEAKKTSVDPSQSQSIVDTARSAGGFTTLLSALEATGLDATLRGTGPFTVFAPTDEAFARLPDGVLSKLDEETLSSILRYHVVAGGARADQVAAARSHSTAQGESLLVDVQGSSMYLNGVATVVSQDIEASNGVIHVIDAVLLPPSIAFPGNIVDAVVASPALSTLGNAVGAANLAAVLASDNGGNGFTVFAPTNAAFAALGVDLSTLDSEALTDILLYHVVGMEVPAAQVLSMAAATTLQAGEIAIAVEDGSVLLDDNARVIRTDLVTDNGIIHIIDAVLVP